ncbi:MAG: radical SAM protein [bacterium]|nr:radical SAM protein [bacterium]
MKCVADPLNEKAHEVLPGLIWKYPNRVLLVTTKACPAQCSFCFRQNLYADNFQPASNQEIVDFVKKHQEIREFIFSGGEPLLEPEKILKLTKSLGKINHLKLFRLHTRLPISSPKTIPFKTLEKLVTLYQKPWYLIIHVNSVGELNKKESATALWKLRQQGFILLSHTVFLKGINDSEEALEKLFTRLIELGVKPYYIFHCDHLKHTTKFVVPLKKEIAIMTKLRPKISGLAYPLHVIDSPTGNGKIPVPTDFWEFNPKEYLDFQKKKCQT